MKNFFLVLFLFCLLLLNIQWHYNRMCAAVFSPYAYFKLDGVYCKGYTEGIEFTLNELLERHKQAQQQMECMTAHPDKRFMCDPRWIPAGSQPGG